MNNLSLNISQSDTLWYTPMDHHHHHHHHNQHQQKPFPLFYTQLSQNDDESDNSSSNNHNYTSVGPTNDNRSETASSQSHHSDQHHREHMFEKPLTPSDVGKLNRLVIPKQHAEKYFPLAGVSSSSAASAAADGGGGGGGGVILGFEDETGKCWRFRYSYWNSSQSYVLTKGWSRYVKEKKLDAGDVVLFERHRFEPERFFIGWRRRGSGSSVQFPLRVDEFGSGRWTGGGGAVQRTSYYNGVQVRQGYPVPHPHRISVSSYPYHHPPADCFHAPPGTEIRQQQESQKAAARSSDGGANSKTLRLFGVNLECQLDDGSIEPEPEPQTSDGSSISSQGAVHGSGSGSAPGQGFVGPTGYNYFDYVNYHHPPSHQHQHHNNHMDVNYAQDVNQMRNRLG